MIMCLEFFAGKQVHIGTEFEECIQYIVHII